MNVLFINLRKRENIKYYIVVLVSILLFIRNYYSFCWSDESYYLANTYRVFKGDVINYQMKDTGYFTYPLLIPFSIWYKFFKTEGIYLFFRHIQVMLSTILGFKALYSLNKYGDKVSIPCAVGLMIYSRANIMGCSYYNVAFVLYSIAALILYDILIRHENKPFYPVIAGILATIAIITNPYIVIPGIFLFVLTIIFDKKSAFKILIGVLFIATLFFLKYFSNNYINTIQQMISPSYLQNMSDTKNIIEFTNNIFKLIPFHIWMLSIMTLCIQVIMLIFKKNLNNNIKALVLIINLFCLFYSSKDMVFGNRTTLGFLYVTFYFFVLFSFPVLFEKGSISELKDIIYFNICGWFLVLSFYLASNTQMDAMTIGFASLLIPSIISLNKLSIENTVMKHTIYFIVVLTIILNTLLLRIFGVYRDDTLNNLNKRIEKGPAKGLYTSQTHYNQYNNLYDDMVESVGNDGTVFVSKLASWAYLCTEARCGSPTSFRVPLDSTELWSYCVEFGLPDYVIILDEEYGGFNDNYIITWGTNGDLTPNANVRDSEFEKSLSRSGYVSINVKSGILYKLPD